MSANLAVCVATSAPDQILRCENHKTYLHLQVPLESLSSELDAYLAVLRNRLLEVINEHYADFVSLSSRLVNVDTAVLRMQKPLLEIRVCLPFRAVTLHMQAAPCGQECAAFSA